MDTVNKPLVKLSCLDCKAEFFAKKRNAKRCHPCAKDARDAQGLEWVRNRRWKQKVARAKKLCAAHKLPEKKEITISDIQQCVSVTKLNKIISRIYAGKCKILKLKDSI